MSESVIDIVAVPDHLGTPRWHAVTSPGAVAGVAGLRPVMPFGYELPEAPTALESDTLELNLYVQPQWRRRGIGSRLLAAVGAHAVGRRLIVETSPGSAARSFCERHGFRRIGSGSHELLTYCDVHHAWLGELVDVEHPGYRLRHWTGDPCGATSVEQLLRHPSRPGAAVVSAAEADGGVVAYVLATTGALPQRRARQYGPAVLVGHRGRRLGLWVNAALLIRLREVHPHVEEIETRTADGDSDLVALRRHLGFRPLGRRIRYELTLP
ncbi:Acetyltransferase (GNAT) family protein [Micromonospora sediminicola]|uniref:Acetyltransferase (GNAT) family protein n=1 Tax=Micromonospora sediminicola TaxID=946078 RepID=A0A1A9B9S8_9ACTN|nr:GNAT family N-acetyltransferase [Micromonospora sediminicola]SBT65729.1 Acetyltransferase (GNAT) family protein [Micromonospora sediminicola]